MSEDSIRDRLMTRAEIDALPPPTVCPRCGVIHRAMSREDYDAMNREHVEALGRAIDDEVFRTVYGEVTRRVYGDYHR